MEVLKIVGAPTLKRKAVPESVLRNDLGNESKLHKEYHLFIIKDNFNRREQTGEPVVC